MIIATRIGTYCARPVPAGTDCMVHADASSENQ